MPLRELDGLDEFPITERAVQEVSGAVAQKLFEGRAVVARNENKQRRRIRLDGVREQAHALKPL